MTPDDWFILFTYALGWAQGLWVGWYIWRKPQLKYDTNGVKE